MLHVLVAEDEVWIRNAIVEMIERDGNKYKIIGEAADGEEAWALINHLWPVILVTDIVLPKKDGLWLIQQIDDKHLPIVSIVISGYDKFSYAQTCIRHGVVEYLLKPIVEEELHKALDRCIPRIGILSLMHENIIKIRNFADSIQDFDGNNLITELESILNDIYNLKDTENAQRKALFSIFASSLEEMHKNIDSIFEIPLYNYKDYDSIKEYFTRSVETLIRRYQKHAGISNKQIIKKAYKYIYTHYNEDIRLKEIAEHVNLSISRFSTVFKKETNDTFVNFLNNVRIEKAKTLLLNSDDLIYEVAEKVGYISLQYFNRVFKNNTGLSPGEFRKKDSIQ